MKKGVIIAVFVIVVIAVAVVLSNIFKSNGTVNVPEPQFPPVAENVGATNQEPAQFVKAFYEWYLLNISKNPVFPYIEGRDQILSPWLTQAFIARWDEQVSNSEADPILLSSEDPLPWGNSVTAQVVRATYQNAFVNATVGSEDSLHRYNVQLVRDTDGTWKVFAISMPI